jgi:phospholipid/cholesterol/gamma-HCH transport system substrate-binding protein
MELTFEKKEKIVGAFMVIIVALLLIVVVMIGRAKDWFRPYVTYYTLFDQAYNLSRDARVKLFTVDVGKVKDVSLDGDKVKVELAIVKDYTSRIRKDTVATVESPTVIGSEYVSIKPGTLQAPPVLPGGTIPSEPKKSLTDFMAEFEVEKTAKMVIKSIQAITAIVEQLRDPNGALFRALDSTAQSLAHIEAVTQGIRKGEGSIGNLVTSEALLEKVYVQLDHVDTILRKLEHTTDTASEFTQHVQSASARAPEIMDELKKTLTTIKQILTNIEKGSRDFPAVTESTKRGIEEMREGVQEIDRVVKSLQQNYFIRRHLDSEPKSQSIDTGLRK